MVSTLQVPSPGTTKSSPGLVVPSICTVDGSNCRPSSTSSLSSMGTVTVEPITLLAESVSANGASSNPTVIVAGASAGIPLSSVAIYSIGEATPEKLANGVNVTSPVAGSTFHIPSPGTKRLSTGSPFSSNNLTLSGSIVLPSSAVSLERRSTVTGPSSFLRLVSSSRKGGSPYSIDTKAGSCAHCHPFICCCTLQCCHP